MFDQLKPIMQNGERYILVEGGRPEYVLMRFSDYSALVSGRLAGSAGNPGHSAASVRSAEWERVNAEIEAARSAEISAEPIPASSDPSTIRLEDLPL